MSKAYLTAITAAAIVSVSMAFSGYAMAAGSAGTSACFVPPAKLSQDKIDAFLAAPQNELTTFPQGGIAMSSDIRGLAGSSDATLEPILKLVDTANTQQKVAIGAGLARVAKACAAADPAYSQLIQQKVAALNSSELLAAFLAASADIQTAALGGGGGQSGPSAGGVSGSPAAGSGDGGSGDEFVENTAGGGSSNRTRSFYTAPTAGTSNISLSP